MLPNQFDTHLRRGDTLIDLACGRGGDLMKWRGAGLRRVLARHHYVRSAPHP